MSKIYISINPSIKQVLFRDLTFANYFYGKIIMGDCKSENAARGHDDLAQLISKKNLGERSKFIEFIQDPEHQAEIKDIIGDHIFDFVEGSAKAKYCEQNYITSFDDEFKSIVTSLGLTYKIASFGEDKNQYLEISDKVIYDTGDKSNYAIIKGIKVSNPSDADLQNVYKYIESSPESDIELNFYHSN